MRRTDHVLGMNKTDSLPTTYIQVPKQGNDKPFQPPYSIPDSRRILFKRTDYHGGGARPKPPVKAEVNGQIESTEGRFDRPDVGPVPCSNIWIGNKTDMHSSKGTDSVDAQSDTYTSSQTGTGVENSHRGQDDHCQSCRISEFFPRNRPKCQTMTAENEMKAQYMLLKEQYKRICEQESLIRNQMALLHAELILMQTNAYHKSSAEVRRINIEPISIRRARNKAKKIPSVTTMHKLAVKVDPMVSTGRYFTAKATKANMDSKIPDIKANTERKIPDTKKLDSSTAENQIHQQSKTSVRNSKTTLDCMQYETGDTLNRCFYFDIPLAVVRPPYIYMVPEKVTKHRLPKLKLPKINTKDTKGPTQLVAQIPQSQDSDK